MSDDASRETWQPTPAERHFRARLLDGSLVEYSDLKVGDVFQTIHPDGVTVLHPLDWEPDDTIFARVLEPPMMNDGSYGLGEGWIFPIDVGTREEMMRALS